VLRDCLGEEVVDCFDRVVIAGRVERDDAVSRNAMERNSPLARTYSPCSTPSRARQMSTTKMKSRSEPEKQLK
jgi:hypothetical protein